MKRTISHEPTTGEVICPYCGVGCRLWVEAAYGEVLRVKGVADAPANLGRICAKGATLPQVVAAPDRRYVKLGKANAAAFGDPDLAKRYADLVAWRDTLYTRYREREATASNVAS